MVENLFPFMILGLEITDFDGIVYYCYRYIWTIQILIAFIYCTVTKRFLAIKDFNRNQDFHFVLRQLNFYFIGVILIYLMEIYYEDIYWTMFERFLHHIFGILLFTSTVYEPNIISFSYLLPTLVHAIYWSFLRSETEYQLQIDLILMFYNILLIIVAIIGLIGSHWKTKRISIRCPLFVTLVFHSNMMGHFYGYNINFDHLNQEIFMYSIVKSTCLALPIYIYLILTCYKKRTN
jgi:hypothetical protein